MRLLLSEALFAAAAVGLLAILVEHAVTVWHVRGRPAAPSRPVSFSILKPLCGLDDELEANLELFAALEPPADELLLGVRSADDPAYPVARAVAGRHADRVRVVVQRGEPGLNAKVNQLVTLEREASREIVVVSDSNVRVRPGFLGELAAALEDPRVGLVASPIVGSQGGTLGSLMDRLHLASLVSPGMIAPKRLLGLDIVVGKTLALRRADLAALGGFAAFKDVLAEDFLLGRAIKERLGLAIRVARLPVVNVSRRLAVAEFYRRYVRWDIIQRHVVGRALYSCEIFLNPILLGLLAWLAAPALPQAGGLAIVCAVKSLADGLSRSVQERSRLRLRDLLATPLKDLVVGAAYLTASVRDTVVWRGHRMRVGDGSLIELAAEREPA
ncbi:MAG TPA: glycosyltransferase [Myxococcales bacterium]|nr:glycosyltransferase [Myxococcales bacterium]